MLTIDPYWLTAATALFQILLISFLKPLPLLIVYYLLQCLMFLEFKSMRLTILSIFSWILVLRCTGLNYDTYNTCIVVVYVWPMISNVIDCLLFTVGDGS